MIVLVISLEMIWCDRKNCAKNKKSFVPIFLALRMLMVLAAYAVSETASARAG